MKTTKKKLTTTFHIIFDAIECDSTTIGDEQFVFDLLMDIPKLLDMKILAGPNIVRDYNPENLGITGIAIISFSHISIHTFIATGEVFIDVFSCKPFSVKKIQKYLYTKLNIPKEKVQTQEVRYPWER